MRFPLGPYVAFAAFGLFWGTWGAALPALRDAARLTEAQLGGALLWVGLGALPAMVLTGRVVDRFGVRAAGLLLMSLATAGILLAVNARDLVAISVGMLLIGATSGASDVAANALAAFAEARSTRRVITLGHAVFSSFVVMGSLGAGALRAAGGDVVLVFGASGIVIAGAGVVILLRADGPLGATTATRPLRRGRGRIVWPFVIVGAVGALGFAAENAHQSWSAIFLEDELGAAVGLAALAPATFGAAAAVTRFVVGASRRVPDGALLLGGAAVASAGTVVLAASQSVPVALAGLAFAAMGTSVMFPTLLSRALRDVPDSYRGRATATISTTAYLGFVAGPVYVGMLAATSDLRGAMVGVAALAAAFAVLAPIATRIMTRRVGEGITGATAPSDSAR